MSDKTRTGTENGSRMVYDVGCYELPKKMTSTAFRDRNRTANTKNYREWLEDHRLLVEMTEAEGFTRDQAVEMVKAYYLYSIESNMGW